MTGTYPLLITDLGPGIGGGGPADPFNGPHTLRMPSNDARMVGGWLAGLVI